MATYDYATGEMCFATALDSLKRGNKLTRKAWTEIEFCKFAKDTETGERRLCKVAKGDPNRRPYLTTLTSADILAEDWVEVY